MSRAADNDLSSLHHTSDDQSAFLESHLRYSVGSHPRSSNPSPDVCELMPFTNQRKQIVVLIMNSILRFIRRSMNYSACRSFVDRFMLNSGKTRGLTMEEFIRSSIKFLRNLGWSAIKMKKLKIVAPTCFTFPDLSGLLADCLNFSPSLLLI
jgi:hypothetical protein